MTLSEQREKGHSMATRAQASQRKQSDATKQAKAAKAAAVKGVKAKAAEQPHPEWREARPVNCSDADWAEGCKVRELRDTGLSWVHVGEEMGYAPGKTGAGQSRRAYKKAFGSLPETARSAASANGNSPRKRRGGDAVRGDAAEKLVAMTDTELLDYLAGKWIKWMTNVITGDAEAVQADLMCQVSKKPKVAEGKYGRFIHFNEADAGSRSIYVDRIHTVSVTRPSS